MLSTAQTNLSPSHDRRSGQIRPLFAHTLGYVVACLLMSTAMAAVPTLPKLLESQPPEYPQEAKEAGQEGQVLIRIIVLPSGAVSESSIISSSGHESLDRAALEAVQKWKFSPAQDADGSPVAFRVPFRFQSWRSLDQIICEDFVSQVRQQMSSIRAIPMQETALYRRTLALLERTARDPTAKAQVAPKLEAPFAATLEECAASPSKLYLPKLLLLRNGL